MRILILASLVTVSACRKAELEPARARRIESLDQAIGGPTASARKGDYLLENGEIRVVIEQSGRSRLPLDVGGSIADMDLVRRESGLRGGRGLDQLGQIAPVSNLYIARALGPGEVRITGSDSGAEVTAKAEAGPILRMIDALGLLVRRDFIDEDWDYTKFRIYNEYELRPGERMLRVTTTVGYDVPFCQATPADGCDPGCDDLVYDDDCRCPLPERCTAARVIDASPLPDRPRPMGLSDLILGDLPRPLGSRSCATDEDCEGAGETCTDITTRLGGEQRVCRGPAARDAGVFLGDMLLFGGHLAPFVGGTGFDTDSDIRRLFDAGEDTLSTPLELDAIFAVGDRVSYGYAAPAGKVLVPIFGGPFSMGATAAASCRHDDRGCLAGALVRAVRWVSVGTGDAASAAEPLLVARGDAPGHVSGVVRWAHSGAPISGAEVFAIADPRALSCDAACMERCGDLSGLGDEVIAARPLAELLAANRCRTPGGAYLGGVAGVETFARTDPGTDPIHDGRFAMSLRPGRWLLVASAERTSLSATTPLEVRGGEAAQVSFTIVELGRLELAIFDEEGALAPGRATVLGPVRPLVPLELGGPRYADGAVAYVQAAAGHAELRLPPGTYEVIISRGPHATIARRAAVIEAGVTTRIAARVEPAVDRSAFASADFHVHAGDSMDSGLSVEDRAISFAAEDMDFLSSSDHDVLTPYEETIRALGLSTRVSSQVGVEVTTQEIGHFIGWPMMYEAWRAGERVPGNGAPEWRELPPAQIFAAMRAQMVGGGPHVVEVPHPYSYFDYYRLDPVTLEPADSIITLFNPLASPEHFSGAFDAMELANAKSFDLLRRPTAGEVRFYSAGLDALRVRLASGELDEAAYQDAVYALSTEAVRRFLVRTPAESAAALAGEGAGVACRCGSDGDCALGRACNPNTMTCEVPPFDLSGGSPPPDHALCRSLRGVIDDWFNMLNRGVVRTGVSGSDTHGLTGFEAGLPRTMVLAGGVRPPHLGSNEVARAVLDARAEVTNGPLIHLRVSSGGASAGLGETLAVTPGAAVSLDVTVEVAGWYDVDRVEVYRSGELIHWISACGWSRGEVDPHGHPCIEPGRVVAYREVLQDQPERDAWYVVIALGVDGRTLAPVYSSAIMPRLGTFEITQRIYDIIPALGSLRTPRFPSLFPTFPFAITNPVWIDAGGDGWTPLRPPPSWCTPGRDHGC